MSDNYLNAIRQHSRDCVADLNVLSTIAKKRVFDRIERRAAERALQVLIEACIGVAKYWLKAEHISLPLDAYDSFEKLAEMQEISQEELKQWRKIIGMRNTLVHDYLKVDSDLVQALMVDQAYYFLQDFIDQAQQHLNSI